MRFHGLCDCEYAVSPDDFTRDGNRGGHPPMIPVLALNLSIVEKSDIAFEGIPAPNSLTGLPER